jgi:selenocysteine-specific elongation factor
MYVIGTAGHVDHGKSALIRALTGIDPDRLQEEKERGLTIDLGFAWLTLPSGREVSIVDVPGHERFVRNMLAGAGGMDLALLVVAADEGVMPQTREHLAILDLLQVRSGVLVLTKKDLADPDWLEMVAADVQEAVKGTTLEGAPLVACSAVSEEGLSDLLAAIEERLQSTPTRRDIGRPRLPIDRAFTIAGFGTVATGTLIDGPLRVGQEVEVVPARPTGAPGALRSRIRGLQTHRKKLEEARPGSRTAVNLAGLAAADLYRGQVVTTPGWLAPTVVLDVRLRALPSIRHPIRHNQTLSFHTGSGETRARVRLLDREEVPPGEEGWAQLRLAAPAAVVKGDLFVVRTANDTVGGGQVVDAHPPRHRRFHAATLEALSVAQGGSPEEALLGLLARTEPCELSALVRRTDLGADETRAAAEALVAEGRAVALGPWPLTDATILYSAPGIAALGERARQAIEAHYRRHPLRRGMAREELKSRLRLSPRVFDLALERWTASGELEEIGLPTGQAGTAVGLPGHEVRLTAAQESEVRALLAALEANPCSPPTDRRLSPELVAYLEEQGKVVDVGDGVVFAAGAYQEMLERIVDHLKRQGTITLAQVRDMFGTSRKYAQALLEYLDLRRVTRRVGDERVLRSS